MHQFLLIPLLRLSRRVSLLPNTVIGCFIIVRDRLQPPEVRHHGGDLQVDDFVAAAVQAALCAAPDSRRQRPNATGAAAPIIMAQGSLGP